MTLLRELLAEEQQEITPEKILKDIGHVFSRSDQQELQRLAEKPREKWTEKQHERFEKHFKENYQIVKDGQRRRQSGVSQQ